MTDQPDSDLASEVDRLRAENARLRSEVDTDLAARDARRARRRRGMTAMAMVVVGSILLPVSVLTVWTRNQVLDTDRYVETVAPIADDPAVQSALANRITEAVSEAADIKSLAQEALPDNAQFLAAPIAAGADNLIGQATSRLVKSDQFSNAWVAANRTGHTALVDVLTGQANEVVSTDDGKVVLRFGPLAKQVLQQIDRQFGLDLADKVPAEKLSINFVLVDSQQLSDVQSGVRWLDRLSWFVVVASLGLLIGSVFVASDRRRGILRVGLGVAISMFLLYLGFTIGRDVYLTNLPSGVERPDVAGVIYDTLTRFVLQAVRTFFVVGLVLVVAAWLAGPSGAATAVRGFWDRLLGRGSDLTGSKVDLGPVPAWVASHVVGLRIAIAAVAALVLVTWGQPTGKVVLLIAVLTLIPLAIVQLLAGVAPREPSEVDEVDEDAGVGEDEAGAAVEPTAEVAESS